MKAFLFFIIILFPLNLFSLGSWLPHLTIKVNHKNARLAFQDDFNGNKIDSKVWEPTGKNEIRKGGWWRSDATFLDGKGNLVIKIFKDGEKYVTGGIKTVSKYKFSYGYYEARVYLQKQQGSWSAFWLWPHNPNAPKSVEIDIFEYGFIPWFPQNALHWYQGGHRKKELPFPYPNPNAAWHTFGLYWDQDDIIWYMDGMITRRQPSNGFNGDCQIYLSVEIGKEAFGDIKYAKLPDYFYVNYVRYYKFD